MHGIQSKILAAVILPVILQYVEYAFIISIRAAFSFGLQ